MAMSSEPGIEENQVAVKVKGDLGNFQIIEEENEESDDDEDSDGCPATSTTLASIPQNLVKPSTQSVYSSVRVTNSENVQFGNNMYFNGPVTIRQKVNKKEQDNPAYEQTEDDVPNEKTVTSQHTDIKKTKPQTQPFHQQLWLKVTFSAVCFVFVSGIICAIVSVSLTFSNSSDNTTETSYSDSTSEMLENSTNSTLTVEGTFYYCHTKLTMPVVAIFLMVLTFMTIIWCYSLLTKETNGGDTPAISETEKRNAVTKTGDKYNVEVDPLLIAPGHLRIVSRIDWLAQPEVKPLDKIRLPVPWVIIQHTATASCIEQSACVLSVRLIQMFHVESRKWYDIGYNFLVGGDGSAYMGRGWEYEGAHTLGYNKYSMGIAFIGTFNNEPPPKKQLDACKKLIKKGVELGKIAKDYKLFAHRQLSSTLSPGDKLFDILKEWPHFVGNATDIVELMPNY